jgi:RNA polymerase sigma-70 factor (ECF subfamily)
MTREEYGAAYEKGLVPTERFLIARFKLTLDEARDFAQAAWVRGWEMRAQYRQEGAIQTWVFTIARNIVNTSYRKKREMVDFESLNLTVAAHNPEPKMTVGRLLSQLGWDERILLILKYREGMSLEEIMETTGLPPTTAKTRLHRARLKLQNILRNTGERKGEKRKCLARQMQEIWGNA